jgi:hypothetical protein
MMSEVSHLYDVDWHIPLFGAVIRHASTVRITEGYTTVEDIPKIIAVSRTGDPSLAHLVIVDKVTEVTD